MTTRCRHCHRVLRSASSIARRADRWCATRAARLAAVARGFRAGQIAKALEAIADRAVSPTRRRGVYVVVSRSSGDAYMATVKGQCNCINQLKRGLADRCWHPVAARMFAATGSAA